MRKSVAVASRATILPPSGTVFESVAASNGNRFLAYFFPSFLPSFFVVLHDTRFLVTIPHFILIQFTGILLSSDDIYFSCENNILESLSREGILSSQRDTLELLKYAIAKYLSSIKIPWR